MAGPPPARTPAKAAELDIAEAEAFRLETIQEAHEAAKKSARAHTELGKKLTWEVRKLEKAADNFFQEAKEQRKRAKRYLQQLNYHTANPVVHVKRAESDEKNGEKMKAR